MNKTEKYEIKLNKKQTFFTVLALIFSLLLVFSIGFLTGTRFPQSKKSSDLTSSFQNPAIKTPSLDHRLFESFKPSHPGGEKTINQFTFYETLPKPSDLNFNNDMEKVKAKKEKRIAIIKRDEKKGKQFKKKMIPKRYTIQLGSFQQIEKAYALKNKFKKQGYLVYVTPKKIENRGTWYRVRMGNFNTLEEAQKWVNKMGTLSPPPFITSTTD